jgi:hypothetical protein
MSDETYRPSARDRKLDREARKSWAPAPIPWLGLAMGTAFGVLFAYAMQESAPDALALLMDQMQQTFVLAISGAQIS